MNEESGGTQRPAGVRGAANPIGSDGWPGLRAGDHQRKADSTRENSHERDLIQRLEAEWGALASGPLRGRLRLWSDQEATLAGFATPQHLLRHLLSLGGSPRLKDETLAALLRQAQSDPLAARVVLQALLPGLKSLARRILFEAGERDEVWSALLAHCWERIRRYPLERRPGRIAANILLVALKKTTYELKRERRERDEVTNEASTAQLPVDRDVERLLRRAVEAAAISADEAELILRTRIDRADMHALAADAGLTYHALNTRRLRAEKRLLLFLGYSPVTFRGRKRPFSSARVVGAGLTGSAGRGAATDHTPRR